MKNDSKPVIRAREIKLVPLSEIQLNPKNRNKHPKEQIARLVEILKYQGFRRPVSISNRTGHLVCGEGRYLAAKKIGLKEIPAIFQDYESAEQEFADAIADNAVDKWAELDLVGINEDLGGLDPDFNLDLMGIKNFERLGVEEFEPQCDEDEVGEPPAEPVSKPGDIYELGRHRLMCGDATNVQHVEALMDGKRADIVWTDPPYNVAYEGKTKDALTIENDEMGDADFYKFLYDAYTSMIMFTRAGGAIYVAHADSEGANFRKALVDAGWLLKQCLVWVKQTLVMGRQDYHWKHEPILYGWAPGAAHSWYTDRKQTTVLEFNKPNRNAEHPTMKPVELVEYCLGNSSKAGDIVLDVFGGSGTTMIASEKLGRSAHLLELDPRYCDVIVNRWERYTGKKANLIAEKQR
jgi:site-specific DNA-methyltransferase (adenine-specific)